jgi:2-polyprenyl-3-methyl-5-hydroxy-6-metoxy-1,4-benzoquinol methylase
MQKENIYGREPIWHVIREIRGNAFKILDVGCGAGATGEKLQKMGHTVYGIDINPKAVTEARSKIKRAEALDLDKNERLPFPKDYFDRIILADVLEHLQYPQHTLEMLRGYLKEDGRLILSVPNIANYKVRWHLLWGRFDSGCAPILEDDSHIKFFTLKTLSRLLSETGYEIERVDSTAGIALPLGGLHIAGVPVVQRMREFITKCWRTLFAFQFVIVVYKEKNSELQNI